MKYNTVYVKYGNVSSYGTIIKKCDSTFYLIFIDSISRIIQVEKKYISFLDLYFK